MKTMGTNQTARKDSTKFGVHLLVVIFGITSWSIMNGLWVELPVLVTYLPEGWTLPSYLTIITQFGFLGLLSFSLVSYLMPPNVKLETPASFVIVVALTLCALLYAFFWSETAMVGGTEHSVALLALTFGQSVFAATTSIAYITFMAHLKSHYMASIFIGMGLSGLIPALAAIGQGSSTVSCINTTTSTNGGENNLSIAYDIVNGFDKNSTKIEIRETAMAPNQEPQFSIQAFFLMLFAVGVMSLLSLAILEFHPYCKIEHVDTDLEESCQLMDISRKQETNNSSCEDNNNRQTQAIPNNRTDTTTNANTKEPTPCPTDVNSVKQDITLTINEPQFINSESHFTSSRETIKNESDSLSYRSSLNSKNLENYILRRESSEKNKTELQIESQSNPVDKDSRRYNRGAENGVVGYDNENGTDVSIERKGTKLSKLESWFLLGLLVWINALQTSFVLAIQVYSSLPYGIQFYHAATKAENIVDPIASFLTFWIPVKKIRVISGLVFLGTLFTGYIVMVAAMSPNPFLVHETTGGILVVTAWVMCTMLMIFSKVSIANVMRSQGRVSLMWTGGSTQLGALIGAVLAYVLINELRLFKDEPWCP